MVPGSTAVVIGAGGPGHMAVQLLSALSPAQVVVVDQRRDLMELLELARAGHVRAHVQTFSLDDAPAAYERMRRGLLNGRAVITPA